jgi:peptidoglycan/LPS O-acetylase OafA/YrhL
MPIAGRATAPKDVRSLEAGVLLIGAGAILLFVSLFLEWYQPGADVWEVFEAWDLVLALLATGALVASASRLGFGPPRPASWLLGPAVAALVIVVFAILDPPPATLGFGGDIGAGLWLALASAVIMTAGAVLCVARITVAIAAAPDPAVAPAPDPAVADPVAAAPGRRFARGAADAAEPGAPVGGTIPPAESTRRL